MGNDEERHEVKATGDPVYKMLHCDWATPDSHTCEFVISPPEGIISSSVRVSVC